MLGASTSRDVAGVTTRAAVFPVTATDGVRERTATVLPTAQLATRIPIRAFALAVRTNDAAHFRLDFREERDGFALHGASTSRDVAGVATRAAVFSITATDGVRVRTAAPLPTAQLATRIPIRAFALAVRTNDAAHFRLDFREERDGFALHGANTSRDVAGVATRAAVFSVTATDGVRVRTAAPLPTAQLATRIPIRAFALAVRTNDAAHFRLDFREERDGFVLLGASTSRDVAGVATRAAVFSVTATDGVRERTATVLPTAQLATRISIRAFALAVRTNDIAHFRLDFCDGFVLLGASTSRDVAGVATRAAVFSVTATDGVRERTAAPLSTAQLATRIPIRAFALAVRTNDAAHFRLDFREERDGFVLLGASTSRDVAGVATRAAVFSVTATDGVRERTAAPLPTAQLATRIPIRAFALAVRTNNAR